MKLDGTYGVAKTIVFPLVEKDALDFVTGATFAAGDCLVSKDGAAGANTTNLPSPVTTLPGWYKLTLTATEMEAELVAVSIIDQTSPKVWEDQGLLVETVVTSAVAPVGARTITATVQDQNTNPVAGVVADVYDASNSTLVKRVIDTDSDGIVAITLNDGTYKVRLSATRFTPDNDPETLVVTADDTVTWDGTIFEAPASADPDLCTVYGFTTNASGAPINGVEISFFGYAPIGVDDEQITATRIDVTTGPTATNPGWAAGYFEIDLIRESEVRIKSALTKLDNLVVTIPDSASAKLVTLTEAAR